MAKIKSVSDQKVTQRMIKHDHCLDRFIHDQIALKNHLIVQNDEKFEFVKGKKFSETNENRVPVKFKPALIAEQVIKGEG